MPTAHIYVRVSTTSQELSPESQRKICLHYYETSLKSRGYELGEVYEDIGQSAFKINWMDRPAGKELFRAAQPGDCIVVAKQDRAFRNVRDRENTNYYCKQLNIGLVLLDAQIDTTTAAGAFAAGIIALQAQWESQVKSERQKAAHVVRRTRLTPFKAYPPPGWRFDRNRNEFVPDQKERALLTDIYKHHRLGYRTVTSSLRWLRHHGVKRECGTYYEKRWMVTAYRNYCLGWPPEGYLRRTNDTMSKDERKKYFIGRSQAGVPSKPKFLRVESLQQIAGVDPASTATASEPV